MNELELLRDSLERLNGARVSYMLTGSMASNFWGIPRSTHDLDFVVQLPPSEIDALAQAFTGDYFTDPLSIREAYKPPCQFNIIHVPSALKLDFWMLRPVPLEQSMFMRRQHKELFGQAAWIATPEDLILHKLYWNSITPSERQINDAAGIVAVQGAALDRTYLRQWAVELGAVSLLEDLLGGNRKPKLT